MAQLSHAAVPCAGAGTASTSTGRRDPTSSIPQSPTSYPSTRFPTIPSGHATTLGGTAQILSHLFQADATFFQSRAEENAASRVWAGIRFPSAVEAGLQLGRDVGDAVIAWAEADGTG